MSAFEQIKKLEAVIRALGSEIERLKAEVDAKVEEKPSEKAKKAKK